MRTLLAGWTAILAALSISSHVWASDAPAYPPCERAPTEAEVAAAKGAFQAGNASFNEADYERALTYWEDAYRRDCTAHPLLLNLARAYELNGDRKRAIVALETFLTRSAGSSDEEQIQRRIAKLREQLEAEQATGETIAPDPEPITASEPDQSAPPPAPDDAKPTGRPLWPLLVGGAGGAVGIAGIVLYATASAKISDLEDRCPSRDCTEVPGGAQIVAEGNSARTRQVIGGAMTIGGLAVGAAGIVYYFLAPGRQSADAQGPLRARTPELTPWVGPESAGMIWQGQF
jgi:hypothetical protein